MPTQIAFILVFGLVLSACAAQTVPPAGTPFAVGGANLARTDLLLGPIFR